MVTKDYRTSLAEAAPDAGLERLFANVVTHILSFQVPEDCNDPDWMQQVSTAMRRSSDAASLRYVRWQSEQDHFRGLPNMFGSLCCNTWGRALSELSFVEAYAIGMRSVDERAERMCFPLDAAYMQVLPQPSGEHRILLTMPVREMEALLKELPEEYFDLPHVSEMRTHAFRVPLPGSVVDRLNPAVETHHIVARVACVGDSLTACGYPKFLQAHFDRAGLNVQVRNFGVAGATAQKFSDQPYWEERKLEDVRVWRPHFVVTLFGTNDAKSGNWDADAFEKDYQDLCVQFLERLEPRPETVLLTPPPVYLDGVFDVQQDVVNKVLPDAVCRVAAASERAINEPLEQQAKRGRTVVPPEMLARTSLVDTFSLLGGSKLSRRNYFSEDGVHMNERGTRLLALAVFAETRSKVGRYLRKRADEAARAVPDNPLGL